MDRDFWGLFFAACVILLPPILWIQSCRESACSDKCALDNRNGEVTDDGCRCFDEKGQIFRPMDGNR